MVKSTVDQPADIDSSNSEKNQAFDNEVPILPVDCKESRTTGNSSGDGYNWRKYGQKHVKCSEFPRSYYKCTHPNCTVKKQMERSHDGNITEIICNGTHDHPKPQPKCQFAVGTFLPVQDNNLVNLVSAEDKKSNATGQTTYNSEPNSTPECLPATMSSDEDDEEDGGIPYLRRRKSSRKQDLRGVDVISYVKSAREPRVVIQTLTEIDILDDGYCWRKYGQKVVKGNPNPRSYYKCRNAGCPVRKHVERASHDLKAVLTTYEGRHNHDLPTARTAPTNACLETRSERTNALNLDLRVGIISSPDNTPKDQQ